jgi:hypothetical protein
MAFYRIRFYDVQNHTIYVIGMLFVSHRKQAGEECKDEIVTCRDDGVHSPAYWKCSINKTGG